MKCYYAEIIGKGSVGDAFEDVERDMESMKADAEHRMAWDSEIDGVEYTANDEDAGTFTMTRIYRDGMVEREFQDADGNSTFERLE